jgi:hypothetical protein
MMMILLVSVTVNNIQWIVTYTMRDGENFVTLRTVGYRVPCYEVERRRNEHGGYR